MAWQIVKHLGRMVFRNTDPNAPSTPQDPSVGDVTINISSQPKITVGKKRPGSPSVGEYFVDMN